VNVYWDNHLRRVYEFAEPRLFLPMVQASRAHVVMLAERGLLPADRAKRLLDGLDTLRSPVPAPAFDGTFEDVYYLMEKRLAEVSGIDRSELDVQLARSRNDLDAGVFRWAVRDDLLTLADVVISETRSATDAAQRYADALIIGFTHRRPAQPTTIGHVLAGLVEARLSLLREWVDVYDEVNVSPLGSAAFAGTDLAIDPGRVAEMLGFATTFRSSYDAVAGAEHLFRPAALYARFGATTARFARTLLDWMTRGWVQTPEEFTQGSSIMPQKRNPVVLEHLCSYAGAAAGDLASVANNIGVAYFEDSNNATTDVQPYLARAADRAIRTARLTAGLIAALRVGELPTDEEIVASGSTATSAAEELARQGIPWRGAHGVIHDLVLAGTPAEWSPRQVDAAVRAAGFGPLPDGGAQRVIDAATDPTRVLRRTQPGSPGIEAVQAYSAAARQELAGIEDAVTRRRAALRDAASRLDAAVAAIR
jgi:argininosuccinate lyase